jgi:L-methionine (R)-S-oxide reductase
VSITTSLQNPIFNSVWQSIQALPILADGAGEDALADLVMQVMQKLQTEIPLYHWVGVYWLEGDTLKLGPYAGKYTDHTEIPVGVGVCGSAIKENQNLIIDDVREISNYLACSTETRAEIVVLIHHPQQPDVVLGQVDLDSDQPGAFGKEDEMFLTRIAQWIGEQWLRSQTDRKI